VILRLKSDLNSDEINIVQPDLLIICDSDQVNDQDRYEGIPSLVVEIISPSTRSKDMLIKLNLYIKSGISEYWIIDPEHEVSYIYCAKNKEIHSIHNIPFDESITSRLFNGLQISVR
jgi:Uma2 family endonuclease